jgi:transposase
LTIAVEVGEISRFASPEKLVSYGRLAPRVHQSGQARPRSGPLSKSGSRLLGWAAVEAAQQAWRESNPWHELYLDVSGRSGNANAAKAAVARTILIAAWHMLSRNQPFKPAPRSTGGDSVRQAPAWLWPPDGPSNKPKPLPPVATSCRVDNVCRQGT